MEQRADHTNAKWRPGIGHEAYARAYFRDSAHGSTTEAINILNAPKPMAMKPITFSSLVLLTATTSAQNLVPNPSFEEYTICPDNWNQVNRAVGWSAYRQSPDYFNACDTTSTMGVPSNVCGYQAASDGQGYAGVLTYVEQDVIPDPHGYREYLGAELDAPLVLGEPVYLSFKVSPGAAGNQFGNAMRWSATGFGMRFSTAPFYENGSPLPNEAALYLQVPILDTATWVTVSGMYVPDSAYQYVNLGNFFSDSQITISELDPDGSFGGAYLFVDEVCVAPGLNACGSTAIFPRYPCPRLGAYPNPFSGEVEILLNGAVGLNAVITLCDELGRVNHSVDVVKGATKVVIDGSRLSEGVYVARLESSAPVQLPVKLFHYRR
mgnify:CR=1 FL=1